jgi:polyketide synthase 12
MPRTAGRSALPGPSRRSARSGETVWEAGLDSSAQEAERRAVPGPPRRSARSGETVWEARLNPEAAWLRDHVVEGEVILPAAGFLDLMLAARIGGVADVSFRRKLAVPAGGVAVQLVLDRAGEVALYAEDGDDWVEIAGARSGPEAPGLASGTCPGSPGPCDRGRDASGNGQWLAGPELAGPELATELARRGFGFGPSYQLITRLGRDGTSDQPPGPGTDASGRTGHAGLREDPPGPRARAAWAELGRDHPLDPPVIDAAIQALTALLPASARPWLPVWIERVVPGPAGLASVARASLRLIDEHHAIGDAWLERADGTLSLLLQGLELRAVRAEPGAWYYDVLWRPAATESVPRQGRWHAIGPGASALGCDSHDEAGTAPLPDVDGVIDLRPMHAEVPAGCIDAVAALVRSAAACPRPPQLVLVSRGASAAPPLLPGPVPAAAVLMGLQPVIAAEHPSLRTRWVDLDPDKGDLPAAALNGPAGRYALRQGGVLTPEIVKAAPAPSGPVQLVAGPERSLADVRMVSQAEQAPGPGEVLIAVEAVGLNFKDVLTILGRVPGRDDRLGLECAGTVIATGPGVGLVAGDAVVGFGPGVLASRAILPASRVLLRPAWLDVDTAASLPVACLTAWHGLHELAGLRPGMRVLVHAGAGGVGSMAVRLARLAGARVFATASTGKHAAALAAGAEAVGDSRSLAFAEAARRWAGPGGFDLVLNALSPEIADASAALLRPGGIFLEIGNASRPAGVARWLTFDLDQPMARDPAWFTNRMSRILALVRSGELAPPRRTVLPLAQATEVLQALGQGRTTGKLVLRMPQPVPVRADGTYLVTGGTGAAGRALAGWLKEAGAGRVVLAARGAAVPGVNAGGVQAPSVDTSLGMLDGRKSGAGCETVRADVADPEVLAGLIRSLPDLRGIVHAAGVVMDGTIERLEAADIAAVLMPKVEAARILDALTRDRPLDFFLLVSSSAGSLAAPGQAAYAGANAWLDRFAAARRAAGLPAASIGSGPWAGGMFARLDPAAQARLQRDGFRPMPPHRAATAFAQVLADGAVHRLVMDRTPTTPAPRPAGRDPGPGLLAVPPAERRAVLERELTRKVVAVLGLPAGTRIDPTRALRDLGLDSLLSVSLRNELASGYGLDLPATLLFDHPTLAALTTHLLGLLDAPEAPLAGLDEAALADLLEREL